MIKASYILLALPLLAACSEQSGMTGGEDAAPEGTGRSTVQFVPMTIYGHQEGDSTQTRVYQGDGLKVLWFSGDQISLLGTYTEWNEDTQKDVTKTANQPFTLIESSAGTTCGEFTGTFPEEITEAYYTALYPYDASVTLLADGSLSNVTIPEVQTAVEGGYDPKAELLLAKSQGKGSASDINDMYFGIVCSGLEITPKYDCTSITVETIKDDTNEPRNYLSGKMKLSWDSAGKPLATVSGNGSRKVILKGDIRAGKTYYVLLRPFTTQHGLSIIYRNGNKVSNEVVTTSSGTLALHRRLFKAPPIKSPEPQCDMVDLGLSVRWASRNVGAANDYDAGDYFAWGETTQKETYTWANYEYGDGSEHSTYSSSDADFVTKYLKSGTTTLASDDDAAQQQDGSWRMPTQAEWQELISNCTWTYTTTYNGSHSGYIVKSNKTGYTDKQIFLPCAGYYSQSSFTEGIGHYWASTLYTAADKNSSYAVDMVIDENDYKIGNALRRAGNTIRPVTDDTDCK